MLGFFKEYGSVPFESVGLCDVDRLIFSQMSYFNLCNAQPGELLRDALAKAVWSGGDAADVRFGFQNRDDRQLCEELMASQRYAGMRFVDFTRVYEPSLKFAAMTLDMPCGTRLIVFRGTDNSLAGWKEDFDLAYKPEIPSHRLAADYAARMGGDADRFELMGHSKGGHLALTAAAWLPEELMGRLISAVSFDGPGFRDEMLAEWDFDSVKDRLRVVIPRSSVVGLLFSQPVKREFVESRLVSVLQHYPYFWKVDGKELVRSAGQTTSARILGSTMQGLMDRLSIEDREVLVESVYRILSETKAETLNDMVRGWISNAVPVTKSLLSQNKSTMAVYLKAVRVFWKSAAKALNVQIRRKDEMKKILFTGFEPFGGESINPSWEAVRLLPDMIGGVQLIKKQVCVEYARSGEILKALIEEIKPDAVVCCGQAGGRKAVTPEICAVNFDHAEAPDNSGEVRRYANIVPGGQNAYFTALSVEKMVEAVRAEGLACAPSFSAGTYVCNHIYYTLLGIMDKGLFVHVPFIPEQVVGKNFPSMELNDIARAIEIIAGVVADSLCG